MEDERPNQPIPTKSLLAGWVIVLLAWLAILYPIPRGLFWQSDTFWLIEIGRNILHSQHIPSVDPYSFTALTSHWIVYQWLSEVIIGMANDAGALLGVAILGAVLLSFLMCVLMFRRMINSGVGPLIAFAMILIVFHATHPEISAVRPQLFSFIFMFLLQSLLEDVSSGACTRPLWSILLKTSVIALVWTNCHVSFPLGLCMIALFTGCSALKAFNSPSKDFGIFRTLVLIGIVFGAATLINPYGIELWSFLKTLNGMYTSEEMRPLNWSAVGVYGGVYVLMLLSALSTWRRAPLPRLLLAVALFVAGCLHARFMIYFCISSCALAAEAITSWLSSGGPLASALQSSSNIALTVVSSRLYPAAVVGLTVLMVCVQPIYAGMQPLPLQAAEFLNQHPPAGNVFCTVHAGSYLMYRFRGALKVFADPRLDLYEPEFMKRYASALLGSDWQSLFDQYHIVEAVIPNNAPLKQLLQQNPDWKTIYQDDQYAVALRRHIK